MFLLMPEEIDAKPLNLETMGQIVVSKKVHEVAYRFIWDEILKKDKEIPIEKSYWILKRKNMFLIVEISLSELGKACPKKIMELMLKFLRQGKKFSLTLRSMLNWANAPTAIILGPVDAV